jgi:hypothetical protein
VSSEARNKWENLIGQFILVCGDIELRLLQIHWNLRIIDQVKIKKISRLGLGMKAKELRKSIRKRNLEGKLKKKLIRVLSATIEFAKYRNLVAHNPLSMNYYDDDQGLLLPPPNIYSLMDNSKHISFDELYVKLDEAKAIEAELFTLVCEAGKQPLNGSNGDLQP